MKADKQELLEALSVAAGLSFFLVGKDGTLWKEKRQRGEPCITERPGYLARLLEGQQETAAVVTDSEVCRLAYAVLSLEGTGETEVFGKETAVFGPCVLGALSPSERHALCARYQLSPETLWIPRKTYVELVELLKVGSFILTGRLADMGRLFQSADPEAEAEGEERLYRAEIRYRWEQAEENWEHLPLEQEQRIFQIVREGRTEELREMDVTLLEGVGRMAHGRWKQIEYMVVSSVTLAARAAMEGGVPAATAYDLSDLYLQRLENCREPAEMLRLHTEMMLQFTRRVKEEREARGKTGNYVEDCKTILAGYLHKPVTIKEIAEQMGFHPCYLGRMFKRVEGIGIKEYLEQERLKEAAELLQSSDVPYTQIADSLCYASQSRFGERFKRQYGVTPAQYRRGARGKGGITL